MSPSYRLHAGLVALAILGLSGCTSSSDDSPTGGTTSTGGAVASGGSHGGTTSSGGSGGAGGKASGGSNGGGGSTGGTKATGGTAGSGGGGSGGIKANGGNSTGGATGGSATGGATGGSATGGGTGGSASGGSATGGATGGSATGGATGGSATGGATGGSTTGGSATGGATGGAGGAGGSTVKTSQGCGSSSPLKSGNFTETIGGTARKWVLDVPTNYDTNKPYRLVFVWHPLGGSAAGVVSGGYNGLKPLSNGTAIFVTADGLQGSNSETSGVGWWNVNGVDMKLLQTMLDKVNANLCVDQDRIFSTGFSFGGMMSYSVGYEFKVFRAIAPCSGKEGVIKYNANNTDPLPIMAFHGNNDTFVLTSLGRAFRDKYVARNKCGTQTQPVSPSPCVEYQGCAAPTIWCEFSGGHNTWSEEPQAIWKFFSQF